MSQNVRTYGNKTVVFIIKAEFAKRGIDGNKLTPEQRVTMLFGW